MKISNTKFGRGLKKHSPKIKKVIVILGMVGGPVLSAMATVKAVRAVDKKKEELEVEKLPAVEIVKTVWPYYIPTVAATGLTIAGAVDIDKKSFKENAALSALAAATEQTVDDIKDKMKNTIGEKKAEAIEESINAEKASKTIKEAEKNHEFFDISTDSNDVVLMFEPITGALFYDSTNNVERACVKATAIMQRDGCVSLAELFEFLDDTAHWITDKAIIAGHVGWNVESTKIIDIRDWNKTDVTPTNKPCLIVRFGNAPKTTYTLR